MDDLQKIKTLIQKNIREQRKRLNLSQLRLANEAGLSLLYSADIENGNKTPSLQSLCKIARALKMQPYQLLMDSKSNQDFDRYSKIPDLLDGFKSKVDTDLARMAGEISAILHLVKKQ